MALAIKIISVVVFQNNILLLPSTSQAAPGRPGGDNYANTRAPLVGPFIAHFSLPRALSVNLQCDGWQDNE